MKILRVFFFYRLVWFLSTIDKQYVVSVDPKSTKIIGIEKGVDLLCATRIQSINRYNLGAGELLLFSAFLMLLFFLSTTFVDKINITKAG